MKQRNTQKEGSNRRPDVGKGPSILLLGDTGRMREYLRREFTDYPVHCESDLLEGIYRLGKEQYSLVLADIEVLGSQTRQVVRAIRTVKEDIPLVLFGDGYGEVYAQPALQEGADDYLVWPIPREEIRFFLNGSVQSRGRRRKKTPHIFQDESTLPPALQDFLRRKALDDLTVNNFFTPAEEEIIFGKKPAKPGNNQQGERTYDWPSGSDASKYLQLLELHQQLLEHIPQGKEAFLPRAESILSRLLNRSWVKIRLSANGAEIPETIFKTCNSDRVIPLALSFGRGYLLLGPALGNEETIPADKVKSYLESMLQVLFRDEALKRMAISDDLTGVYNRRYLEYFTRNVLEHSRNEHTEVTLLLFDIDEFKYFNDTFGHAAGDEILREATRLMRRCCREHDIVARIGGDEFAVLFWDTGQPRRVFAPQRKDGRRLVKYPPRQNRQERSHPEMVMFMSNRFRRLMMTREFPCLDPDTPRGVLSVSGGLASFPWDAGNFEELLNKADQALLQAKRSGKNRIYLIGQPDNTSRQYEI